MKKYSKKVNTREQMVLSNIDGEIERIGNERYLETSTIDSVHTVLHQVLELAIEDNPSDNALKELKKAYNRLYKY